MSDNEAEVPKSTAPDEFLKRNKLEGFDEAVVISEPKSSIDLTQIPSILQPKTSTPLQ